MDLVKLTENIVKSLVVNVDAVSVKEFPTDEENVMLIQVLRALAVRPLLPITLPSLRKIT